MSVKYRYKSLALAALMLLVFITQFSVIKIPVASTVPYVGIATRFNSGEHTTSMYQAIEAKMTQYGMNTIRIGSSDMFNNNFPWNNGDAVDWFLINTNFYVIIDRHHTIQLVSLSQSQLNTINTDLETMAERWASYGDRLLLEPVNEYGGDNFYAVMQPMINNFRSHGYTNWLIFNRMGYSSSRPDTVESYSWQTLDDPLGKTIQGGHYYMGQYGTLFSSNIGQRCFNAMNIGYGATGQPLLGTEEGLDWYESTYFTQAEMNQFNSYLQLSFDAGFGNVVWLNHGLSNMAAYEHLNIHFPDAGGWVPPPPVQETLYKLTYSTDGRGVVAVQPQNSSGLYSPGVQVTMTATGYSGYALGNWRVDGASQLPTNPLTFVMDKNHTVLAEFISSGTNPPPVNNATEPILVETYKNHAIYGLATGVFYVDSQSSYTFSTLAAAEQYIDTISPQPPAPTSYLFSILTISIVAAAGVIVFRKRLFGASRLGTFAYRRSCLKPRK